MRSIRHILGAMVCAACLTTSSYCVADAVNAADYQSLQAAAQAGSGKTLVISGPIALEGDVEIPRDTHLSFLCGGMIVQTAAHRLTIRGPISAPPARVFSGFSPGQVIVQGDTGEVWPEWWGAGRDGATDDAPALQCALDSRCPVIRLLAGQYLIRSPLNLTNRHGVTVIGSGSCEGYEGTRIVAETGSVALDVSGSRHIMLRDFVISAGGTNPATVGILFARTPQTQFVEFNSLDNVGVILPSLPQANDGNGTVGIYNYAAEVWRGRNLYVQADTAVVFTGYNVYKIQSPFVELFGGYPSMSQCTIDGVSTLRGLKGPCVLVDNGTGIEILNAYFCGGAIEDSLPYAVKVTSPGFYTYRLTVTGHNEKGGGWLWADVNLRNLHINGTGVGPVPVVYLRPPHGTIVGGEICVDGFLPHEPHTLLESPGPGQISGVTFTLFEKQRISVGPGTRFSGNTIKAALPAADVLPLLSLPEDASYILAATDRIVVRRMFLGE